MNREKVVGILGGMGPFATLDFFKQILHLTPAEKDWDHLRVLIDNNVKIPSRTRAVLYGEESPAPKMIESINNLAKIGADFVAVPCISAHYFYKAVAPYIDIPWLNIIQIVAQRITKMEKKRPLILGGFVTISKRLFSEYIPEAIYLLEDGNRAIEGMIEEIKLTAKLSMKSRKILKDILQRKKREIDCAVLACTELPIVYSGKTLYGIDVVNSTFEYAKALVTYAKS